MDVKIFEKKRPSGRPVALGQEPAPQGSYDYLMDLSKHLINPQLVADAAPREFCTAPATGGIAEGQQRVKSSQVFRQVIDGSFDAAPRDRCCHATAGMSGRDKSLTGAMMAGVRLNVPSISMYGSAILPDRVKRRDGTAAGVFKADARNSVGDMPDGDKISIEAESGQLGPDAPARAVAGGRAEWRLCRAGYRSGVLGKQAQQVGSARLVAATRPGMKNEVIVYADQ